MGRIAIFPGLLALAAATAFAPPNDQGAAPNPDPAAAPSPEEVTAQLIAAGEAVEAAKTAEAAAQAKAEKLEKELAALKAGAKAPKKAKGEAGDAFRVTVVAGTVHHPRAPNAYEDAAGVAGVPYAGEGDEFTVTEAEAAELKRPVDLGMVELSAL